MALDLSGFVDKPNEWEGLYKAGDTLERRSLKKAQMEEQRQARKNAAGTFLNNYLDPKDYLSGTAYDPMIVKGLQELMQQGAKLAADGVDTPTLMMALGPGVSKISNYSTRAKTIDKQVDEQIKGMKDSGATGFDYRKLKDAALQAAFYDEDESGNRKLNIEKADPSINWVGKSLETNPEDFTTSEGLDEYAKKSPMSKTLQDVSIYDEKGELNRTKAHVIGQNWTTPEYDSKGAVKGLVPKYEVATDSGKPIMETYKDKSGKEAQREMRLLDEGEFDQVMKSSSGSNAYLRGQINLALKDYQKKTGEKIDLNDPKAKRLARAVAYKELDQRKATTIEAIGIQGKPSPQQVTLAVGSTPGWQDMVAANAAAAKEGRLSVQTPEEEAKALKTNAFQAIGGIFKGDQDFLGGPRTKFEGRNVIDVTSVLPGGGLKKGRGDDEAFKEVYFDPKKKELIVTTEEKDAANRVRKQTEVVTEKNAGQFLTKIAEANGIPTKGVRSWLDKIGYKNNKFEGAKEIPAAAEMDQLDIENTNKILENFKKDGSAGKLTKEFKGKKVGDQEVVEVDTKFWGNNKFQIKLKGPDGKTETKLFKNKEEVANFLKAGNTATTTKKGILD